MEMLTGPFLFHLRGAIQVSFGGIPARPDGFRNRTTLRVTRSSNGKRVKSGYAALRDSTGRTSCRGHRRGPPCMSTARKSKVAARDRSNPPPGWRAIRAEVEIPLIEKIKNSFARTVSLAGMVLIPRFRFRLYLLLEMNFAKILTARRGQGKRAGKDEKL